MRAAVAAGMVVAATAAATVAAATAVSRPAGERRPRLEDPPAIGGPVRREQAETAPKSEKSAVEQEILSANTGKRYGKIDI